MQNDKSTKTALGNCITLESSPSVSEAILGHHTCHPVCGISVVPTLAERIVLSDRHCHYSILCVCVGYQRHESREQHRQTGQINTSCGKEAYNDSHIPFERAGLQLRPLRVWWVCLWWDQVVFGRWYTALGADILSFLSALNIVYGKELVQMKKHAEMSYRAGAGRKLWRSCLCGKRVGRINKLWNIRDTVYYRIDALMDYKMLWIL